MKFVKITKDNLFLLTEFIGKLGDTAKSFRYFTKRTVECIQNHLATFVLTDGKEIVAYGHLDKEAENIWLGICVLPKYQGNGYGNQMMKALVNEAINQKLTQITLTVDNENKRAIKLYEAFDFKKVMVYESYSTYVLKLQS